jgi:hypothetical protein
MTFSITFKTPDAMDYALKDIEDEDEREEVKKFLSKFIKYSECITVEFDTKAKTATVV